MALFLEEPEYRFDGNDDGPVDQGDGGVCLQTVLAEGGVDDEVGAAHEVDDADEEHDGCVFQYIDRFTHQSGNGDRERLGSDDAENAPYRRKSENDSRFMLSPVNGEVSGAEYFRNNGGVVESKGDQHIHGEGPAVGINAESPYDGGEAEIDEVKVKNKGHAPVIGKPYIAESRKYRNAGNPDDCDDCAEEEAEQDGRNDDFHREREGGDQPGKYAYEKGWIKSKHGIIPLQNKRAGERYASSLFSIRRRKARVCSSFGWEKNSFGVPSSTMRPSDMNTAFVDTSRAKCIS